MENQEHSKRLLALPPNLRSLVCAGAHLESMEFLFSWYGEDISDEEVVFFRLELGRQRAMEELQPKLELLKRAKSIAEIAKGIPWNKKQQFNRPIR